MRPRRSKAGFLRWLDDQKHRDDKIGWLAREVVKSRKQRGLYWLTRLLFGPDRSTLTHAMAKAFYEYDRQFDKKSVRPR